MPDYNLRTPISSININNGGVADVYEDHRIISNEDGPSRLHQAVAEGPLVRIEDLLDDKVCRSRINKETTMALQLCIMRSSGGIATRKTSFKT